MTQNLSKSKPKSEGRIRNSNALLYYIWRGRLTRIIMEGLSVSISILILWLGALGLLMSRKSVDLEFFKPHYEQWFSEAFSGKTANIDQYTAKWIQDRQAIEIHARNIMVTGNNGAAQSIADVRGEFSVLPNLLKPELTRLDIKGGALTIIRDKHGVVQIGLGSPDTFKRVGALWTLGGHREDNQVFDKIKSIELNSAQIYIRHERAGFGLDLKNVDGKYGFDNGLIHVSSHGNVLSNTEFAPYQLNLNTAPGFESISAKFNIDGVVPAAISPKYGPYAFLTNLDAPVDLDARVEFSPKQGLSDLKIHLNVEEGQLKTGATYKPFTSAKIKAEYNAPSQNVEISTFIIKSEALSMSLNGELENLGTPRSGMLKEPIAFDAIVESLHINPGQKYDGPIVLSSGVLSGQLDVTNKHLKFDRLNLDFGSFQTVFTSLIKSTQTKLVSSLDIDGIVTGTMTKMQLLGLWPKDFAPGTRNWFVNSLQVANLSNLKLHLALDEDDFSKKSAANDHLNLTYDMTDADVRYLLKMPWLRGANGYGILQGNQFEHHITSGTVDGLAIQKGKVSIPRLSPGGGDITVDLDVTGTLEEMLRVSNFEPFEYANKFGFNPKNFDGSGALNISVTRPLQKYEDRNRLRFELAGDFSKVGMPIGQGAYKLNDGALSFHADRDGVEIFGPIKIGKWQADLNWEKRYGRDTHPASYTISGIMGRKDLDAYGVGLRKHFGGDVLVSLKGEGDALAVKTAHITADFINSEVNIGSLWSKQNGAPGHLNGTLVMGEDSGYRLDDFTLDAQGLSMAGSLSLANDLRLNTLDMPKAQINGLVDASIQIKPTDDALLAVYFAGKYLNVEPWVKKALKVQSSAVATPILLTASLEKISLNENYHLQDASALFSHNGTSVQHGRLKGQREEGEFLAEITKNKDTNERMVRVQIPDASRAALTLLGLNSIEGGQMVIDGHLPASGKVGGLKGNVKLTDFVLVNAPIFTKVLSLASLQGMADTLGGDGLTFSALDMDFALEEGVFKVRDGRASGPALGLTGEGNIDVARKRIDFNGVVVPSYTVNSILGDIPLLGGLIVGKKGEGMFALNYSVKGPFTATQVGINPLSALTPGFLRRIFDVKRDKIADPAVNELIETQKQ